VVFRFIPFLLLSIETVKRRWSPSTCVYGATQFQTVDRGVNVQTAHLGAYSRKVANNSRTCDDRKSHLRRRELFTKQIAGATIAKWSQTMAKFATHLW